MATGNKVLLNTDILVYAADSLSRLHSEACLVREKALKGDISGCLSHIVLREFLIAVTSRKHVTNPLDLPTAMDEYNKYVNLKPIRKIGPTAATFRTTAHLIKKYNLSGSGIHLAETVAVMMDNRVDVICTFQEELYEPFSEISVMSPFLLDDRQTSLSLGE